MRSLSTIVDSKSTTVVCGNQQMLSNPRMAMGKRILERITELGWKQTDLCARVPEMDPQALNTLIKRDSKTSKFAPNIATALGLRLHFLMTGEGERLIYEQPNTSSAADAQTQRATYTTEASPEAQSLIDRIRFMDLNKSIPSKAFKSIDLLLASMEQDTHATAPAEKTTSGLAPDASQKLAAKAVKPPKTGSQD